MQDTDQRIFWCQTLWWNHTLPEIQHIIWIVPARGLSLAKQLIKKKKEKRVRLLSNFKIYIYFLKTEGNSFIPKAAVSQFCVTALPSRFIPRALLFIFPPLNNSARVPHHGNVGLWAASRLPQMSLIYFCYQDSVSKPYYLVFSLPNSSQFNTLCALQTGCANLKRAIWASCNAVPHKFVCWWAFPYFGKIFPLCAHLRMKRCFGIIAASRCAFLGLCLWRSCPPSM